MFFLTCALALAAALIAWFAGRLPNPPRPPEGDGAGQPERLAELREHLHREFFSAVRAVTAIPSGTVADRQNPQCADRITAAEHNTGVHLCRLRNKPPEPLRASALRQGRRIGLALVEVEAAALTAARRPDDDTSAADLAGTLAALEEAVDSLQLLVQSLPPVGDAQ